MRFLRTNTAVRVTVGPFFDKTDGVTPETALTVTSCKLTFMVDDANVPTLVLDTAPTASGGANDMVHVTGDDAGFYDLELAAANVNYLGRAMLAITDAATHCPVFHEFMILPAMIYDSLVLGTDRLDTNATHFADQAISAAAGVTLPSSVASPTNITAGTITTVTNLTNAPTAGDLTATMKASVNAEVLDVLNTDTFAEPGQEAPPATTTLVKKIGYLYKMFRNKKTQTATTFSLFGDDASTVDQKATVSDDATTATRGEIASGP